MEKTKLSLDQAMRLAEEEHVAIRSTSWAPGVFVVHFNPVREGLGADGFTIGKHTAPLAPFFMVKAIDGLWHPIEFRSDDFWDDMEVVDQDGPIDVEGLNDESE